MNFIELLAEKEIVSKDDVEALQDDATSSGFSLEKILIERNIDPEQILEAKGEYFNIPPRHISDEIPPKVLQYVPEESARHYKFVPLAVADNVLEVGLVGADDIDIFDAINFIASRAGMPYKAFIVLESDFEKALEGYKGLSSDVSEALEDLETTLKLETNKKSGDAAVSSDKETPSRDDIKEDAPITKIVATILEYAVSGRASDIHIEPMNEKVRVRFRVDGIMHTSLVLPVKAHNAVVARIKILTSMRIDEKRKPQDGRFRATIEGRKIDFRVSTFPTYHGEKVVMRILDTEGGVRKLDELGFSDKNLSIIKSAINKPYGLILISGPTGSGKSSTLYSMLNEVERDKKNVLSLEDPIEYTLEGLSQSQVFPEIGYTFASGLRSTLRQDPDVIMVGEIRDNETAQLAIQAALTGHLVLSTVHTNSAIGVVPRLIDMGVDPYLIAPTLIIAIAQRLVRTLCPDSGEPFAVEGGFKIMIEKQFEDLPPQFKKDIPPAKQLYEAKPTGECPNGTRGRAAVLEVLEMNDEIERAILTNPSEETMYTIARNRGMLTMKEDAIIKALNGEIPFDEINTLGGDLLVDEEATPVEGINNK